ncbi:hypothetical protein ANCCEY_11488 [Ancylostoma ceylanicum]|uniref:Uncharacterized protein n=1 Tax=Ancylostoma ceylanicum TaxID=53326 RepID=A0A0D6LBJ8_9BILA|nr:hypothetical protein ANCCEY_11488 [Ancylostoma ceylanicum]
MPVVVLHFIHAALARSRALERISPVKTILEPRCLANVGIYPADSRDELHRQRFLPWTPEQHYNADLTRSFLMDPTEHWGPAIFHENLVSMHHLGPEEIRLIDGLLYGVAAGIWNRTTELDGTDRLVEQE